MTSTTHDNHTTDVTLKPLQRNMLGRLQVRERGSVDWELESPKERATITLDPFGRERAIFDVLGIESVGTLTAERYALWVRSGEALSTRAFYIDTLYGYQTEKRYE